jgi:hypothetical protein
MLSIYLQMSYVVTLAWRIFRHACLTTTSLPRMDKSPNAAQAGQSS